MEGADLAFADLRPAVSRRSARAILEFVDAVFAEAKARDGISSTDDAIHHDAHRSETGRVEIWPTVEATQTEEADPWDQPVDAPSRSSAQTLLASRIATRIAEWLDKRATIPGTDKPITPGDIMILVRRRNAFAEEMIRQLLDKRVPVAGADRMVLMEQIAIADLVALGRFALLPEDDLNLAALLKSPWSDSRRTISTIWRSLAPDHRCGKNCAPAETNAPSSNARMGSLRICSVRRIFCRPSSFTPARSARACAGA